MRMHEDRYAEMSESRQHEMMTMTRLLLLAVVARVAAWAPTMSPRRRSASVCIACSAVPDRLDATIDELLAEAKPEALPGLMGRRLEVLTDGRFLARLESRRSSAPPFVAAQLQQLGETVVDFLEELTENLVTLEPELADVQAQADAATSRAAEAAAAARQADKAPPARRAKSTPPPVVGDPAVRADVSPPMATDETVTDAAREEQAKHRFLLETLLDAAKAGGEQLDSLLAKSRTSLDGGFFRHLQWEIDEQRTQQNTKLLALLEVVVQRACAEVEGGAAEVELLSALLQTQNKLQRAEMCERALKHADGGADVAQGLLNLVTETQLELEKRVLKGETVDASLLQSLRVIALEAAEYTRPAP